MGTESIAADPAAKPSITRNPHREQQWAGARSSQGPVRGAADCAGGTSGWLGLAALARCGLSAGPGRLSYPSGETVEDGGTRLVHLIDALGPAQSTWPGVENRQRTS